MTNYQIDTSIIDTPRGNIHCTEYIPKNGGNSAVILSHGFNSCADDLADVAKKLAECGIYAVCYDFNGGGVRCKSTGKTTDMSILTEQADLRDMISLVRSRPQIKKIYLYGESQGGFVSALTAPEFADIEGIFLVYPAFVIPNDWLNKQESELQGEFDFMGVKLTKTYFDGVPRYDVIAKAAEFTRPIRIWHGAADPVVDPEYSLKLVKACNKCELTVFSGLGHWFPPEYRERVADEIAAAIIK